MIRLPLRVRFAHWVWKKIGAYLGKYIASRTQEPVAMGVSIPGYLFLDGNWMPDRHASVQQ